MKLELVQWLRKLENSESVNEDLFYIASERFRILPMLMEKSHLYTIKNEELNYWREVTKCQMGIGRIPLVVFKDSLMVIDVLRVIHLHSPITKVVQVDDSENVLNREVEPSQRLGLLVTCRSSEQCGS